MLHNFFVVHPKEIALFIACSPRKAQRMFKSLRQQLNKNKGDFITADEFCRYYHLPLEEFKAFIMGLRGIK